LIAVKRGDKNKRTSLKCVVQIAKIMPIKNDSRMPMATLSKDVMEISQKSALVIKLPRQLKTSFGFGRIYGLFIFFATRIQIASQNKLTARIFPTVILVFLRQATAFLFCHIIECIVRNGSYRSGNCSKHFFAERIHRDFHAFAGYAAKITVGECFFCDA